MANYKTSIDCNPSGVKNGLKFMEETLSPFKIRDNHMAFMKLKAEEVMNKFIEASKGTNMSIIISRTFYGSIDIKITCEGERVNYSNINDRSDIEGLNHFDLIRLNFSTSVTTVNINGINEAHINVHQYRNHPICFTIAVSIIAVLLIFVFRFHIFDFWSDLVDWIFHGAMHLIK